MMTRFQLESVADTVPGSLPLGIKQRLSLAAAVIHHPKILILDEPTSGLDPIGTREVKELVCKLAAGGMTVLLTSHQLFDVQDICSRVAVMS